MAAKPGQSSFRRTLLSRILLLSIPVLLTGEYVMYKRSRDMLLDTARTNLKQSAIRKGENIRDGIDALKSNLITASEAFSTQLDQPQGPQELTSRMVRWMPKGVECIQLTNLQTGQIESSSCGNQPISQVSSKLWPTQSQVLLDPRSSIRISSVPPTLISRSANPLRQLSLVFNAPIYDSFGQIRYALSIQAALLRQDTGTTDTIVIDQNGTVLADYESDRIGINIKQEPSEEGLRKVFDKAITGDSDNDKDDKDLFLWDKIKDNTIQRCPRLCIGSNFD
ncbi:hypothetical protein K9N68_02690 [Kovacikia minuta CCNUW1]|uniref:hypothetical protein n=1 Tax=Kovacikia minuta TaxID=2931930 RepID=UPI001CC937BE|nr:hypothetical protein [Kovacikia minuta]UBF26912.1 hypothetical protein K9N68_02690 [Kovacikia minuta CCNUW1]